MAIPKFLEDLLIISKLGDNPGADNGLSSSGLREKFDEAGVKIQKYINDTLIPALSGLSNPEEGLNMKNDIAMGGHRVTGLGEPVADGDAVPRGYANGHFAPAGYGLGGHCADIADWNAITKSGFYRGSVNTPNPSYPWYGIHMDLYGDGNYCVQIIYPAMWGLIVQSGCRCVRVRHDGVWSEWEWENPPMELGVEYRTTKRHNGKALYVIRVNVGALPNRASNGVPVTKTDGTNVTFTEIVEISGVAKSSGGNNPMGNQGGLSDVWITNESKMTVNMLTTDDLSSKTLEVTIWYTKD